MAEDDDSKTEEPTGRRLDQAREEGDVVQSHEVKTAAMLTAIAILVWLILPSAMNKLRILLTAIVNANAMVECLTAQRDALAEALERLAIAIQDADTTDDKMMAGMRVGCAVYIARAELKAVRG